MDNPTKPNSTSQSASDEIARVLDFINSKSDDDAKPAAPPPAATNNGPAVTAVPLDAIEKTTLESAEPANGNTPGGGAAKQVPQELPVPAELQLPENNGAQSLDASTLHSNGPAFYLKKLAGVGLAIFPYLLVFGIGVAAYYLFIADRGGSDSINITENTQATDEKARKELLQKQQDASRESFEKWIDQFYFRVTDANLVAMDTVAPNGLTNFENFLISLNPKTKDANNNGLPDAQDVLEGKNPETGQELTQAQKENIARYFNLEAIRTRLTSPDGGESGIPRIPALGALIRGPKVAQAASGANTGRVAGANQTAPNTPASSANSGTAPNQNIPTTIFQNRYKLNLSIPGRLEIPAINVNVPVIWTQNTANFDADLKKGAVHHPATPLPGDMGTSYISGHSSNWVWAQADFNKIFSRLNELHSGSKFTLSATDMEGKTVKMYYTVDSKQIFQATDPGQFANFADSRIALSTCWPIGQLKDRLVAFAKLEKVEQG